MTSTIRRKPDIRCTIKPEASLYREKAGCYLHTSIRKFEWAKEREKKKKKKKKRVANVNTFLNGKGKLVVNSHSQNQGRLLHYLPFKNSNLELQMLCLNICDLWCDWKTPLDSISEKGIESKDECKKAATFRLSAI